MFLSCLVSLGVKRYNYSMHKRWLDDEAFTSHLSLSKNMYCRAMSNVA